MMHDSALHRALDRPQVIAEDAGASQKMRSAKFERWDRIGVELVRTDLKRGGRFIVGTSAHFRVLAEEWLQMKDAQRLKEEQSTFWKRADRERGRFVQVLRQLWGTNENPLAGR